MKQIQLIRTNHNKSNQKWYKIHLDINEIKSLKMKQKHKNKSTIKMIYVILNAYGFYPQKQWKTK